MNIRTILYFSSMNYSPDVNAEIDLRIRNFELELLEYESTLLKFYFSIKKPDTNRESNDRIWNHYFIEKKFRDNKMQVAFGFHKISDLDYKIKEKCFEIFRKHFPDDGIEASLTGYPQQF